jgi:hypothetical protein
MSLSTADTPRSSSPATPEPSDAPGPVAVRSDFDNSKSWHMHQLKSADVQSLWDIDTTDFIPSEKTEDHQMLRLDDLIETHAYEEYVVHIPSIADPLTISTNSLPSISLGHPSFKPPSVQLDSSAQSLGSDTLVLPSNALISPTKPIPPPASLPRKKDPLLVNQRVVYPPKESCFKCVARLLIYTSLPIQVIQSPYHLPQHSRGRHKVAC